MLKIFIVLSFIVVTGKARADELENACAKALSVADMIVQTKSALATIKAWEEAFDSQTSPVFALAVIEAFQANPAGMTAEIDQHRFLNEINRATGFDLNVARHNMDEFIRKGWLKRNSKRDERGLVISHRIGLTTEGLATFVYLANSLQP